VRGSVLCSVDQFISLRFAGNGVLPSNTRCREVAALLKAAEDLIESAVPPEDLPDDGDGEAEMSVSVVAISDQSLGLRLTASYMAVALVAWQNIASAVETSKIERLPVKTRESLGEIFKFVKKRNCTAELSDSRHPGVVMATITPDMELRKESKLSGKTSLIGKVIRVGGADPKVVLKLPSGKNISCETSEDIAIMLGHRLYDTVSCSGYATWCLEDYSVSHFRILEVRPFKKSSASEAFSALAAVMPKTIAKWRSEGVGKVLEQEIED